MCQCEFTIRGDSGDGISCPSSHFLCSECTFVFVQSVLNDLESSFPVKCSLCRAEIPTESFERQLNAKQLQIWSEFNGLPPKARGAGELSTAHNAHAVRHCAARRCRSLDGSCLLCRSARPLRCPFVFECSKASACTSAIAAAILRFARTRPCSGGVPCVAAARVRCAARSCQLPLLTTRPRAWIPQETCSCVPTSSVVLLSVPPRKLSTKHWKTARKCRAPSVVSRAEKMRRARTCPAPVATRRGAMCAAYQ